MFYLVYVLQSLKNGSLYVGLTAHTLQQRLKEHNEGLSQYTKSYRPWKVIHFEGYLNKADAARREQYLKSNQGARVIKLMLNMYFKSSLSGSV